MTNKIAKSKRKKFRPLRPVEEKVLIDPGGLSSLPKSVVSAAMNRLAHLGYLEGHTVKTESGRSLARELNYFYGNRREGGPGNDQRPVIKNPHYIQAPQS